MTARAWRWAVVVLAVAVLTTGCHFNGAYDLPLPGAPVSAGDSYQVTADFDDILDVVPKSPVMVDDVVVGYVTKVERVGWHARVTMRVRKDIDLPDNAVAEIKQVSLLGEKYVDLAPPTDVAPSTHRLGEGDQIPLSATGRNPEVEEVLGALSYLLSGGGVAQLATITSELNKAMDGRQDQIRHLFGNLDAVIGTLDDQKADIISALESVNNLTATLNQEKQTIAGALDVAGPAVKVLADQHDQLIHMLTSLDRLGVVGTRVIGASKDNLIRTLAHLQPILAKLRAAGDKLAPGLNLLISFPFPKEASEIVKGDYANTSIRADLSLTNFGPPGGVLPPIPPINPGQTLSDVQKCLQSGSISSQACQKVLSDANALAQLKKSCATKRYRSNPVCQVINQVPTVPGTGGGSGGGGGGVPGLPGLPGLPGVGRSWASAWGTALSGADATAYPTSRPTLTSLYAGGPS